MNERIKQLAEQAEIKFEPYSQHQGVDTAVIIPTDLEKFAELLIKECTAINLKELSFTAYALLHEKYCEHFGVEE